MLQKLGHPSARVAFEMMYRQKCQFSWISQNFEKIMANPFASENGPIWQLIAYQN